METNRLCTVNHMGGMERDMNRISRQWLKASKFDTGDVENKFIHLVIDSGVDTSTNTPTGELIHQLLPDVRVGGKE